MLANQGTLLNANKEDYNNFVSIPIDLGKSSEQFSNVQVLQGVIVKTLPNGSICLVEDSEFLLKQHVEQDEYTTISFIEEPQTKNIRTILLQPPKPQSEILQPTHKLDNIQPKRNEVVFKCIKCNEEFNTMSQYRKHMVWHRYLKKYKCTKCSAGYNVESNYKIHMAMHSEGKPTCPICNLSFQRIASLKSHLFLHQVEETYTCDECKAEFDKEDDLIKHLEVHATSLSEENKALICSYCKVEFDDSTVFKEHVSHHIKAKKILSKGKRSKKKSNKDGKYTCEQCKKSFIKHSLLERHERIHSGVRPYVCNICKRGFTQRGTLQIHLKRHEGIKPYQCTLCPAKFGQKGNLKVHIEKTHTASSLDERKYKCFQCSCIFKKISSLNGHMTKIHTKQENSNFDINTVMDQLKQLEKKSGMVERDTLIHEKKDENLKKDTDDDFGYLTTADVIVKVPVTGQLTALRKYLVRQRKIGDTRFYFCNYCMKKFKKPSDLIRHIRIHTKEKPFKCKVCGASFSLKSTLLSHSKRHQTANKEYICPICNGSFVSLYKLNFHLRRHNILTSSYSCKQCGKTFTSHAEAKEHSELFQNDPDGKHFVTVSTKTVPHSQNSIQQQRILKPKITTSDDVNLKKVHQCKICPAKFSRPINFKKHMQSHNDNKNSCALCCKCFRTPFGLNMHMNYHLNIRNYQCNICEKKFVTSTLLKRHHLVHVTQKPYACWYCDKYFKTLSFCKQHMKRIHKMVDTGRNTAKVNENLPAVFDFTDMVNEEIELIQAPSNQISVIASNITSDNTTNENVFQQASASDAQSFYDVQPESIQILADSTNTALLQDQQQYETIYINSEGLQLSDNSNMFSQLKLQSTDCLLLNSINDLQDPKILFNSDNLNTDINYDSSDIINVNQFFNTSDQPLSEVQHKIFEEKQSDPKITKNESINLNALLASNVSSVLYPNVSFSNELSTSENTQDTNILNNSKVLFDTEEINSGDMFENTNFICAKCNGLYANIDEFKKHKCDVGMENVNINNDIDNGQKEEHLNNNEENGASGLQCPECKKIFKVKHALGKHMESHKKDKNMSSSKVCQFCNKCFKKNCDLQRHIRTHTGEKPFACNKCDKNFALKSTLASHVRTHDPNMSKKFNCPVCNSFFISKSTLKQHMSLHTGTRPYACSYCPLKYRTLQTKNAHEMNKHKLKKKENNREQNITSLLASVANEVTPMGEVQASSVIITPHDICSQELQDEVTPGLSQQLQIVPNDILQQLQSSNIIIQDQSTLESLPSIIRLDDLTLLNFKSVSVDDSNIPTDFQLQSVSATNDTILPVLQNPRNLECDVCHKRYGSKDVLRKHKKIHGLHKQFVCNKCTKGFDKQEEYNKHIKLHMGYRPHSCKFCTNSFADVRGLNAHIKRIHSNDEEFKIPDKYIIQL